MRNRFNIHVMTPKRAVEILEQHLDELSLKPDMLAELHDALEFAIRDLKTMTTSDLPSWQKPKSMDEFVHLFHHRGLPIVVPYFGTVDAAYIGATTYVVKYKNQSVLNEEGRERWSAQDILKAIREHFKHTR
jgi:hypothetical protein